MVDVNSGPGDDDAPGAPLAQLRRRYDELRADYESLLGRLRELESAAVQPEPARAPVAPRYGLVEGLLAPLEQLQAEYHEALASLQGLVDGLGTMLGARLKGQRLGEPVRPSFVDEQAVQVDVRGRGAPMLLAFRDRLAALPGVAAVNIHAADQERATLIVELQSPSVP